MTRLTLVAVCLAFLVLTALLLTRRQAGHPRSTETGRAESATVSRPSKTAQNPVSSSMASEPNEVAFNGLPKLEREKVEAYLARHRRNASSLLAAFHGMDDTNYLLEAARNFPDDPQVQWTVLMRDLYPEDRRKWLDAFKTSSPSNSLANYLSAQDYFKAGDSNAAMQELRVATGKTQFDSFETSAQLDAEELFLSSGLSPLESFRSAMSGIAVDMLPELASYKLLSQGIAGMQNQYAGAGNAESLANTSQAGLAFADQIRGGDSGKYLINGLVGNACEAIVLKPLDPNTAYDFLGGQTPTQRLEELRQIKKDILQATTAFTSIYPTLSEPEQLAYAQRVKIYGEYDAMRWLQQRYGSAPQAQ